MENSKQNKQVKKVVVKKDVDACPRDARTNQVSDACPRAASDKANYHGIEVDKAELDKLENNKNYEGAVSTDNFPEVEEMKKKLQDVEQLANKITKDNYVIPFGKFKGMTAKSLMNIETINKYNRAEKPGVKYICYLVSQPWLHDKDRHILSEILMG